MIPFSFSWNTQKRSISLKWDGFFSSVWEKGKVSTKFLGFPIPIDPRGKKFRFSMRWVYLKVIFSFLRQWKLKKVEGSLSLPDPMMNGLLYGWMSAFETGKVRQKINVSVNFLGENWCRGELILSPKIFFSYLIKRILPLIIQMRKR